MTIPSAQFNLTSVKSSSYVKGCKISQLYFSIELSPTAAFVGVAVVVGAAGTLGQTFAVVAYSAMVATHCAVVEGWPIAQGAVSVAVDTLILMLAGKGAVGTVANTRPLQEEVVLLTFWPGKESQPVTITRVCVCSLYQNKFGCFDLSSMMRITYVDHITPPRASGL